jgi:hypothetical protein
MSIITKDQLTQRMSDGKTVIEDQFYSLIDSSVFIESATKQAIAGDVSCSAMTINSINAVEASSGYEVQGNSARISILSVTKPNDQFLQISQINNFPLLNTASQAVSTSAAVSANIIFTSANVTLPSVTKTTIRNTNSTASVSASPVSAQMRIDNLASGAAYTISAGTSRTFYMFATARMYVSK